MTYLWGGMILIGILYGGFTGNFQAVTEAVVSSAEEAVSLCIAMAGITAMWTGVNEDRGKCRAGFTAGRENAPNTEVSVSTSESGFSCLPLYFSEFFIKFIRNLLGEYQRRTLRHERTVRAGRKKAERNAATGKKRTNTGFSYCQPGDVYLSYH